MKLLSDLPPSSRYTVLMQPLWAVFGKTVLFYAPLFMKDMGLNEIQIGTLNTVNLFFGFIWQLLASTINNRIGRKKTILIFDMMCWTLPMLLWGFASNYWWFLAAAIVNSAVKVAGTAWYCLLSEDTREEKRAKVFGIVNVVNTVPGMIMPAAGWLMVVYGVIPVLRVIYLAGAAAMMFSFIMRNHLIEETRAGKELMRKHREFSFIHSISTYVQIIIKAFKNREFILISLIYMITNFVISVNFIQVIFMEDYLGFDETALAMTQFVTAGMFILVYFIIVPRLRPGNEEKMLTASLVISAIGSLMLLVVPKNNLLIMLLTITILAVGTFVSTTYRDAVFMNRMGDLEKADMYSAVQILVAATSVPAGFLAGFSYTMHPLVPFIGIAILFTASVLVSIPIMRLKEPAKEIPGD